MPYNSEKDDGSFIGEPGLTKREFFAAAALQGILANPDGCLWKLAAEEAVKKADELIFELNKQPGRQPYEKPERV